jgi:hypothetical protein
VKPITMTAAEEATIRRLRDYARRMLLAEIDALRAALTALRTAADAMHSEITEQLDEQHDQGCQSEDAQIERDAHAEPDAEDYGDECSRCGFLRVADAYQAVVIRQERRALGENGSPDQACRYCGLSDGTQVYGQSVASPACRDVAACNGRTRARR